MYSFTLYVLTSPSRGRSCEEPCVQPHQEHEEKTQCYNARRDQGEANILWPDGLCTAIEFGLFGIELLK